MSGWKPDRRTHRRVAVGFRVVEQVGRATYFQWASNLSVGGLYLEGTLPHPPGTQATLMFVVPGERAPVVSVTAEVVATTHDGGEHMRFVEPVDPALAERLEAVVARHAPEAPETPETSSQS